MKNETMIRDKVRGHARGKRVRVRHTRGELVRRLRARMPELVARYGVKSLGIFGSYLRGEQKARSDFDVLVEFDSRNNALGKWIDLRDELQGALGVKVDLVENENLKPFIGKRILSEVVWLRRDGQNLRVRLPRQKNGETRMSTKREYLDFMSDIVRAMSQTERFVAGVTFDEFIQNEEKVLAATKAIENIGEAVKNIPADVCARYPEIDWKNMAKMRDRTAHGYFSVDLAILWETATERIPVDKPLVAAALEQELARRAERDAKKENGKKKNGDKK